MGMSAMHGQFDLLREVALRERIAWGPRIAELGNQIVRFPSGALPAKEIFEAFGAVQHVSFDINGKDGALPHDLSEPLPEVFFNRFDIVTNFGTSEHVEASQYWCWRNIHELCKLGGLMLHAIPCIGHWPNHGHWHYSAVRINRLAQRCGWLPIVRDHHSYTHIDGRNQDSLLLCFRKQAAPFVSEEEFQQIMFPEGEPHY